MTEVTITQADIDLDTLPPQIEALRAHAEERRGKGWLRSADNLEASAYLIETLAAELARHRTLTPAQAAGPVLLEKVARAICRANAETRFGRESENADSHEAIECQVHGAWDLWLPEAEAALAAITQAEGPQA